MKKISYLAAQYPKSTAVLIIMAQFIQIIALCFIGIILYLIGIDIPTWLEYGLVGLMALSILLFPKGRSNRDTFVSFRKHGLILQFCIILAIAAGANRLPMKLDALTSTQIENQIPRSHSIVFKKYESDEKRNSNVNETPRKRGKSKVKQKVRDIVKQLKHQRKKRKRMIWLAVVGILLALALASFLGYLVAFGYCELACMGKGVAAVLLLTFGFAGIITGLYFSIRFFIRLIRKNRSSAESTPEE